MTNSTLSLDLCLLSPRQAQVYEMVSKYYDLAGEPCSAGIVGRKLGLSRQTVRQHIQALYRKGWLVTESDAMRPRRPYLRPRD